MKSFGPIETWISHYDEDVLTGLPGNAHPDRASERSDHTTRSVDKEKWTDVNTSRKYNVQHTHKDSLLQSASVQVSPILLRHQAKISRLYNWGRLHNDVDSRIRLCFCSLLFAYCCYPSSPKLLSLSVWMAYQGEFLLFKNRWLTSILNGVPGTLDYTTSMSWDVKP